VENLFCFCGPKKKLPSNWKKKTIHSYLIYSHKKSFFARAREREREREKATTKQNTRDDVCDEHHHDYYYGENVSIYEREIFFFPEEDDDSDYFYTSRL